MLEETEYTWLPLIISALLLFTWTVAAAMTFPWQDNPSNTELLHPTFNKILLYAGVLVVFPLSSLCCIYYAFIIPLTFTDVWFLSVIPLVFLFFFVRINIITLRLVKFIPAQINYDQNGFTLRLNDKTQRFTWADIKKIKRVEPIGVMRFFDLENQCVLVLYKMMPGFPAFIDHVNQKGRLSIPSGDDFYG